MINYLLILVPVAFVLKAMDLSPTIVFIVALLAIVPLAEWVRKGTEHIAVHAGPAIGGLINVTFGNMAELVLILFLLQSGDTAVVKATITGAIVGNSLFGLGISILAGSKGKKIQTFNRDFTGLLSSLFMLSVIALIMPALFDYTERYIKHANHPELLDEKLSLAVAVVLILVYVANLIYTLLTHRDIFALEEHHEEGHKAWPLWKAIAVLVAATVVVALVAELASGELELASHSMGVTKYFVGLILLPLAGNASEYFSTVYFARKGQMTLVMQIALGASIQIALLTAPLIVLISYVMGTPVNLVFESPLELIALASVAFIVNAIAHDGETTWFEGLLLVAVYVLFGLAFFFVTP